MANGRPFVFVRLAFAANFRAEHSERSFDDEAWGPLADRATHKATEVRRRLTSAFLLVG